MEIKSTILPKSGDLNSVEVRIISNNDVFITYTGKLSRTEMRRAITNGIIKNENEGVEKLKNFSINRATEIHQKNLGKKVQKTEWFSPFW